MKREPFSQESVRISSPKRKKEKQEFLAQKPKDTSCLFKEDVKENLLVIETWDQAVFNVPGVDLIEYSWKMFGKLGFIETFSISPEKFLNFSWELRWHYDKRENPFHNFYHGFAVAQSIYYLISQTSISKIISDDLMKFTLLFSGLCHDVSHTGRNNAFEANTLSKKAIRYNDKSILEQSHVAKTFKMLSKEEMNIMSSLEPSEFKSVRKWTIQNILATDMKEHIQLLASFKDSIQSEKFPESNEEDLGLLSKVIVHASDLNGPSRKFEIAEEWSQRVSKEFTAQYQDEVALGLPVTEYFKNLDSKEVFCKSEFGFIAYIVLPTWDLINIFLKNQIESIIQNLRENKETFEMLRIQAQKENE